MAGRIDPDALALAPFVARNYHGGQRTAMYAYASSGAVTEGLAREAWSAYQRAFELGDVEGGEAMEALALHAEKMGA